MYMYMILCLFTDPTCEEHVVNNECPKTPMVIETITQCLLKSYVYYMYIHVRMISMSMSVIHKVNIRYSRRKVFIKQEEIKFWHICNGSQLLLILFLKSSNMKR